MKTFKRALPVPAILSAAGLIGCASTPDVSPKAGLAPIYLAIAILLSLSMFGFVIAAWPESSAASVQLLGGGDAAPAMHPFAGSMQPSRNARGSGSRMRWM